jgi:diguanylate cyclase (GGDEF)-like protein
MLGANAAIAIRNAQLLAEVEHLARTDSLTGLLNRRAFEDKLVYEIARAQRYNYALSLLMIDIDDFKQYNDKFGHSVGDEHLKVVSDLIVKCVRLPDMVARIGGEEFTVILPHTSKKGGINLAERIRESVAHEFRGQFYPGSTVSIGVATYPEDAASIKGLYIAADNAMFDAKGRGKNKVRSAVPSGGAP